MNISKDKTNLSGKKKKVDPGRIMTNPWTFISFGFGSGLSPVAPGTMGTLVAIPVYFLMNHLPFWGYWAVLSVIFVLGVWTSTQTEHQLDVHDHSGVVIDEIAGFLITMAFTSPSIPHVVAGFILFRLFDILKPWPINWLDRRVGSGLGIMLDDVAAGFIAGGCLRLADQTMNAL